MNIIHQDSVGQLKAIDTHLWISMSLPKLEDVIYVYYEAKPAILVVV